MARLDTVRALEKRGLVKSEEQETETLKTKECPYCNVIVGFGELICHKCKHPLNREVVLKEKQKDEYIKKLEESLRNMESRVSNITNELMEEFKQQINDKKTGQNTSNISSY